MPPPDEPKREVRGSAGVAIREALEKSAAQHGARPKSAGSAGMKEAASSHGEAASSQGEAASGQWSLQFRTNLASMDTASLMALSRLSTKLGSKIETMVQSELDSRPDTQEAAPSVEVQSQESSDDSRARPPACQRITEYMLRSLGWPLEYLLNMCTHFAVCSKTCTWSSQML